jgi:catechol 2,3-dioxygenase-like lactoylglutathione lyase family enzyme
MNNALKFITIIAITLLNIIAHAQVKGIEAIGITVKEMDRSIAFYKNVLGFTMVRKDELYGEDYDKKFGLFGIRILRVRMKLGNEYIDLIDYLTSGGRSIPENARSNDLFFQHIAIVVSDMDKAYLHLRKYSVEHVSTSPQTIPLSNAAAAGIRAFYFHDPDGHSLELIYFPKGKGQDKWQSSKGLFLGIDHTAIAISNTARSLGFYQMLGLERKSESWNNGIEQERLNAVEGASLHITGLTASSGPGVEFLEYLKPGPGKSYPADSKADDIWHWQITLFVDSADMFFKNLKAANAEFISKELVMLKDEMNNRFKTFLVRDPDGHALQIVELVKE